MGSRKTLSDCYENSQFKDSTKIIFLYKSGKSKSTWVVHSKMKIVNSSNKKAHQDKKSMNYL